MKRKVIRYNGHGYEVEFFAMKDAAWASQQHQSGKVTMIALNNAHPMFAGTRAQKLEAAAQQVALQIAVREMKKRGKRRIEDAIALASKIYADRIKR